MSLSHQSNGRFNVSFITGRHSIKTGVFWMYGLGGGHRTYTTRGPDAGERAAGVLHVLQRQPDASLTQFASPSYTVDQLNPDLGLYVQDQWRISRVTISAGLRFDWLRESVKATEVPAGMLVPARSFPARTERAKLEGPQPAVRHRVGSDRQREDGHQVRHQPLRAVEHDRPGATLRPGGRRGQQHDALVERPDVPVGDPRRSNFLPDCNLVATTANGECGAMANPNFGTYVPGEFAGSRLDHGLGQADLQLADVDQRRSRADTQRRRQRRVLPHVVRQLPGDRQPARDARRLQPLLRDRAGGRSVAAERPADVRALRHQSRRVRPGGQPDHAQQRATASRRRSTTASM